LHSYEFFLRKHRRRWTLKFRGLHQFGGTYGEHEPITGVWGQSPQRGPGAEPLVRWSGGLCPSEAES